jgi:adhesin HecA-like repeat protein
MSTDTLIAPAGTVWQLDPVHSTVGFEVSYLAGTFKGQFREVSGSLTVEGDHAKLEGTARVASIDVKDETLATHLQSPDFFDAEQFPELHFRADRLVLDGGQVQAEGELTMKGVTKPITLSGTGTAPMTDAFGNERVGLNVRAVVDRTAFGISWNMPLPTGQPALSNDVAIIAELYFVKAA